MIAEALPAFLLGLLGGAHCLGMCGPIALALAAGDPAARLRYVFGRCLYNAGRVCTYGLLGAIAGALGNVLHLAGLQRGLSIAAGLALLAAAAMQLRGPPRWWHAAFGADRWPRPLARAWRTLVTQRTGPALFAVGLLNGLLPCGLVAAALAPALASGHASRGALLMLAFGLGTFPVMLAVALAGRLARDWQTRLRPLVPVALGAMALLLIVRGLGLGIPYLSPDAATGACPDCAATSPP